MVWVQIPSREEQNLTALKSNSNTVWFNFQTYIYIYIYIYKQNLWKFFRSFRPYNPAFFSGTLLSEEGRVVRPIAPDKFSEIMFIYLDMRDFNYIYIYIYRYIYKGPSSHDRMVVVFTNTYAISVYHHWCCEFESRSGRSVQHCVIKFVSELR